MAVRCPGCGKFLSEKDEKCKYCGAILKEGGSPVKKAAPKKQAPAVKKEVVVEEEDVEISKAPDVIRNDAEPIIITRYEKVPGKIDLDGPSYFDGKLHQLFGWTLLGILVSVVTVFICFPLAYGWIVKWEAKHTVICGYRQVFDGRAGSLIPRWMLWMLLTILTLTIYGWWNPIRLRKWKVARLKLVKEEE